MSITIPSLLMTCIISFILIYVFSLCLKSKKLYSIVGFDFLTILFFVIIFRLIFPIEIGLIFIPQQNKIVSVIQQDMIIFKFLLWIWIIGMLTSGLYHLYKIIKIQNTYQMILKNPLSSIEINNKTKIVTSPIISTPMIIGFYKTIFIPDIPYTEEEKFYILLHERKHIIQKDMTIKTIIIFLSIVYWWFLPIYDFKKLAEIYLEIKVDKNICGAMKQEDCISYMNVLLSIARKQNRCKQENYFSNTFGSSIEYRINYFFNGKKTKTNIAILFITLLIPFLFCFTSIKPIEKSSIDTSNTFKYQFDGLNDNDKILQLPGGGWLYGEAEITYGPWYNRKKDKFSSFTDTNAITVKEYNNK